MRPVSTSIFDDLQNSWGRCYARYPNFEAMHTVSQLLNAKREVTQRFAYTAIQWLLRRCRLAEKGRQGQAALQEKNRRRDQTFASCFFGPKSNCASC